MNETKKIILYPEQAACCGCGACMNVCPKSAIQMQYGSQGSQYPVIDEEACVNCGLCMRVCNFQKRELRDREQQVYAAAARDGEMLKRSASGGIFAAAAKAVIENGGIVYGCAMERVDQEWKIHHIGIDSVDRLMLLQGSKYVQSDIGYVYAEIKKHLDAGKLVLFSGTPCQVDGLYGYLRNRDYENLFTIDIICHGVPGQKIFQDYIRHLEKKLAGTIIDFSFRDKTNGWGLRAKVTYKKKNGNIKEMLIPSYMSSYYSLFLRSELYRENCYSCKYAKKDRVGDLTIGDFWGFEEAHPEYLKENGGAFSVKEGVSCILVNSKQGERLLKRYGQGITVMPSCFEKAAKKNEQLNVPSKVGMHRELLLKKYEKSGYQGIESGFVKITGWKYYVRKLKLAVSQLVR